MTRLVKCITGGFPTVLAIMRVKSAVNDQVARTMRTFEIETLAG